MFKSHPITASRRDTSSLTTASKIRRQITGNYRRPIYKRELQWRVHILISERQCLERVAGLPECFTRPMPVGPKLPCPELPISVHADDGCAERERRLVRRRALCGR